jgi:TNF receptor-associated protein 1
MIRLGGSAAVVRRQLVARASRKNGPRSLQTLAVTTNNNNNNLSSLRKSEQQPHNLSRNIHVRAFSTSDENDNENDEKKTSTNETTTTKNAARTMEFQAETKQLLDIVTNSLYTDKEVFLRELISNASDACEKLRHLQQTTSDGATLLEPDRPLEIRITLDEVDSKITIQDTGIGMTQDELIQNLGTIARSGSKQFLAELQESDQSSGGGVAQGIIGKFGVGFYSVFMVAHKVAVTTQPAKLGEPASVWTSKDGSGTFELATLDDPSIRQDRGTTVDIYLDSDYWHLLQESKIKEILNKYSNFVAFPIYLNGERVNTIQAVWAQSPREVEYQTYADFYKYIANAVDDPLDVIHFRADAPLEIQALLFIPSFHSEKYGMERMEPGVSLYSRKVLIESKSADILPDWLRFVKGVVDSQDLPLAISREKPQDTALIAKLRKSLTRKFLSQLEKMAK